MDKKKEQPLLRLLELSGEKKPMLYSSVFLAVIAVLGGMVPYWAAGKIIIKLLQGISGIEHYALLLGIAAAGCIIRSSFYAAALSVSHRATFSILKDVRGKILCKLPRMPLGTVIDRSSGELKQIIVDQVETMERPLAHLLPEMTSNLLGPLCIFIYLCVLDWRMALIALVSIPAGMLFLGFVMKTYAAQYAGFVKTNSKMNSAIVEYIGGIEVIKTFNQGAASYAKFSDRVFANAAYCYNWMKSCQLPVSLSKVIAPTTFITVLPLGWLLYTNGSLPIETFIMSIILSAGIAGPLLEAINFADTLAKVGTTASRIDLILRGEEQIHKTEPVKFGAMNIQLKNVSFGYHDDCEIIHDVTMEIKEHSLNAFVGASGSGKSTIAKLIAGYWDIPKGSITVGAHEIRDIPLTQLYDSVAFVSQDNFLFNDTVLENIRIGNVHASDEEVIEAAKRAGCHEAILKLEKGYDTLAGSGGTHISGGERQRIAIARALLKNAPVIILDEATAYIDPENEASLQKSLSQLTQDKTVIVIAHRLSTITESDSIFLIEDGTVAAQGRHEELLQNNAAYQSMWHAHLGAKE
ncbi:ABC transporter ATP-binding protein [Treponema sp. OMZ 840]|uniref:ABC transporter ATP-binding protein n=1 Tax=Treponema sp. OMZ 840 TaxID=244313 RepID=UPI003D94C67A